MIPRPLSDDSARYNPGRWICNTRPEKCKGLFRVYGQDMPCPIRAKCFWGRGNSYQWTPGPRQWGRFLGLDTDATRRNQHRTRLMQIRRTFDPAYYMEIDSRYRQAHREQRNEWMRRKRREQAQLRPEKQAPPHTPLPCGEDCEGGCPYDSCPYTDQALDALAQQDRAKRLREQSKQSYRRKKAREAIDPEYAARRKAQEKTRCKRYYEAHKQSLREKARQRQRIKREQERMKKHDGTGTSEGDTDCQQSQC